jgi:hypothetical protein
MLNLLQIWRPAAGAPGAGMSAGDVTKNMQSAFKDVDVGPFDVADKFFREPNADFDRRLRHYFVDTSMTPLLVYENYLSVSPPPPPGLPPAQLQAWLLHRATLASDFIACSDVVGARILKEQQWGLAPLHGALSCLAPGYMMQGNLGRLQFPQWLGRNSTGKSTEAPTAPSRARRMQVVLTTAPDALPTGTKRQRLLRELTGHLSAHVSGSKEEVG